MSRSTYMLIAFAPPAASVPPSTTAAISHGDGRPRAARHHGGDRRDEQQLDDPRLREGDVGAHRVDRSGLGVRGTDAHLGRPQPPRRKQQPDRSAPQGGADGQVRHDEEGGQARRDVEQAERDLDRDEDRRGRGRRRRGSGASVERWMAMAVHATSAATTTLSARCAAWIASVLAADRGDERAVHERDVGEGQPGVVAGDPRPEQHLGEDRQPR